MVNNLYVDLWENYRPVINNLIKNGGGSYQLAADKFQQRGNRDSYSFRLVIVNGEIPVLDGSAVARDLKTVLDGSKTFKANAVGKRITIRLTSSFILEVSL